MIHQHQFPFGNENKVSDEINILGTILFFGGIAFTFWVVNKMAAKNAALDYTLRQDSK